MRTILIIQSSYKSKKVLSYIKLYDLHIYFIQNNL